MNCNHVFGASVVTLILVACGSGKASQSQQATSSKSPQPVATAAPTATATTQNQTPAKPQADAMASGGTDGSDIPFIGSATKAALAHLLGKTQCPPDLSFFRKLADAQQEGMQKGESQAQLKSTIDSLVAGANASKAQVAACVQSKPDSKAANDLVDKILAACVYQPQPPAQGAGAPQPADPSQVQTAAQQMDASQSCQSAVSAGQAL